MTKDMDELLEIPKFLKRKPARIKRASEYIEEINKWWMPDLNLYKEQRENREERKKEIKQEKLLKKQRKKNKLDVESSILDIIPRGYNTFGKIRKYIKELEDKDIRNALNRLINKNKVIKVTKRIYALNIK